MKSVENCSSLNKHLWDITTQNIRRSLNVKWKLPKLDQHKMTHNVEKSLTCLICGKKFLGKGDKLYHVKNIHYTYANFITTYPVYVYELLYCYISLNFDFVFVKFFVLLTIDQADLFSDGTFMSTISFMLCFLFKQIGGLHRLLIPTLLCLCRLPI